MSTWKTALDEFEDRQNLMIVDGLNLSMRYKHKGAKEFAADYLRTINSLAKSYEAKEVVILSDRSGSVYRRQVDPRYKANRTEKYKNQTEEEKQDFQDFLEAYNKALDLCRRTHKVVVYKGVEADDVAAYLVGKLEADYGMIWLISTDGDWDQLISRKVNRFAYTSRKEVNLDNFYEMTGCDSPEQLTQVKAIMGDRGDNIIGVDGVGIKRAYGLVREHGSVFDIVQSLPWAGKQLYIQNLNKTGDKLLTNLELVDLPTYCAEAIHVAGFLDDANELVESLRND